MRGMIHSALRTLAACSLFFSAVTAATYCPAAAPPLSIVFENDSGVADADVYIGFVGGTTLAATNAATSAPLSPSTFATPNWYPLSSLSQGIDLTGYSGRMYVCYGSPWTFVNSGYEPASQQPSDPNFLKRYDKIELTYFGNQSDVADTTSFDYFSIPMELRSFHGGTSGTLVAAVTASPTDVIRNALSTVTPTPGAAVVTDGSGNFVRVIGPSVYPAPPGLPASPYPDFDPYLTYLHDTYAPAHSGNVASIAGNFAGVSNPSGPSGQPQTYNFTATIDANKNITLDGTGSVIGHPTLEIKFADLTAPTGIYGANPHFYLDGSSTPIAPPNDLYGWLIGDLLAGLNVGAVGSTVSVGGTPVGEMGSQQWFTLTNFFAALQPSHPGFYNTYAATLSQYSQAYNFAYTDRFAHVLAPLNPGAPDFVDTLQVKLLAAVPEPSTFVMAAAAACLLMMRPARRMLGLVRR